MGKRASLLLGFLLLVSLVGSADAGRRRRRARAWQGKKWQAGTVPVKRRTVAKRFDAGPGKTIKVAFFDADSTLRVSRSGSVSANGPRDVMILPGVAKRLIELQRDGYLIAVVSNQGGVEKGYVSLEDADAALLFTVHLLARQGAYCHYYDFAEATDEFRKPRTGMADMAEKVIRESLGREIAWDKSFMVGDSGWKRKKDREPDGTPGEDFSNSDRLFAEAVAKKKYASDFVFHHPRNFFGWVEKGIRNFHKKHEVLKFKAKHPDF